MSGSVFTNPLQKWAEQPSFVVGEYLFILGALVALIHAWKQDPRQRPAYLAIWIGAVIAGTMNDLIFMALPTVDNFWHGQATIMLTPRLPLYILCVYIWFMYIPTVVAHRANLPRLSKAALAGLMAIVVYEPFDVVGAKYLWWTWHDTDPPIADRFLGVPISSTMWVVTFVGAFSAIATSILGRTQGRPAWQSASLAVVGMSSLTTILMVLQMALLQQLTGGVPGRWGAALMFVIYLAVGLAGSVRRRGVKFAHRSAVDRLLYGALVIYFVTLAAVPLSFDPEAHQSVGVHQPLGDCYVDEVDFTGRHRYRFLCRKDYDEDYSFTCTPPAESNQWYTICGQPHTNWWPWISVVAGTGLLGIAVLRPVFWRRSSFSESIVSGA